MAVGRVHLARSRPEARKDTRHPLVFSQALSRWGEIMDLPDDVTDVVQLRVVPFECALRAPRVIV